MKHHRITTLFRVSLVAGLAACAPADADIVQSGPGGVIPDNNAVGVSSQIFVAPNVVVTSAEIEITSFRHSWVGDLIVTVQAPTGETIQIMNRTGPGPFGDSSNLGGDYRFVDGGANWWAEAGARTGGQILTPGAYAPSDAAGNPTSFFATFNGVMSAGLWTLNISDNAGADLGDFAGWTITLQTAGIPEPSTAAIMLLLCSGWLGIQRRRLAA